MPSPMTHRRTVLAVLTTVLALLAVALLSTRAPAQGSPSPAVPDSTCFGAAARDPLAPCRDPQLRLSVVPLPDDALLEPNARCTPVDQTPVLLPCAFGVPKEDATAVVALVGDSHASHWRAALEVAAQEHRWRGISITRSSCPFSTATAELVPPERSRCRTWNRKALGWFRIHPEVHTVFVSEHSGGGVVVRHGSTALKTQVAGYAGVWAALPPSVTRIFVIRDTPRASGETADCVVRAKRAGRPPGASCALDRHAVLKPDPAAIAATHFGSDRVKLLDLTAFMCSKRLCLPVIGGALVHKDLDHLTQTFATTLGPYLSRRVTAIGVPEP